MNHEQMCMTHAFSASHEYECTCRVSQQWRRAGDYVVDGEGKVVACTSKAAAFCHQDEWAHMPATIASDSIARLIAEAPAMLEALQELAQTAREYVAEGIPRLDAAIEKAAMVALKARGELLGEENSNV